MICNFLSNEVIDECKTMIKGLDMKLVMDWGNYDDTNGWKNIGIKLLLKDKTSVNIVIEEDQRAKIKEQLVFGIKSDKKAEIVIPYVFTDKDGGPFIYNTKRGGYTWLLYRSIKPDQLNEFFKFIELCIAKLRGL